MFALTGLIAKKEVERDFFTDTKSLIFMNTSEEAIEHLTTCCKSVGTYVGTGRPYVFLQQVAKDIEQSKPSKVFPDRYKEHVAYAVYMIASNGFLSPPAAIASVYLVTRFEYYFRILSGKLKGNGTWISPNAQDAALAAINDNRLKKKLEKKQISSVALAYRIMIMDTSLPIVQQCALIDNCLYPKPSGPLCDGSVVNHIGDRIEFGRNSVGHGYWGDISAEAVFYGLLTGIVFYNQ